jgi:hypothetical protein
MPRPALQWRPLSWAPPEGMKGLTNPQRQHTDERRPAPSPAVEPASRTLSALPNPPRPHPDAHVAATVWRRPADAPHTREAPATDTARALPMQGPASTAANAPRSAAAPTAPAARPAAQTHCNAPTRNHRPRATSPRRAPAAREQPEWETDTDSADDVQEQNTERYGVLAPTNARRARLTTEILTMCPAARMNARTLFEFGQRYRVGTRLSYIATVRAELARRGIKIHGDVNGVLRAARLEQLQHHAQRAAPMTAQTLATLPVASDETHAILTLMWKTASRLTSIAQLETADIKLLEPDRIEMTFRRGKTILATGVYCLWATVDERTYAFVKHRVEHGGRWLTDTPTKDLYAAIAAVLRGTGFQVRSFRRGALQAIAAEGFAPEDIRILSRHTTNESLYKYLNDGAASAYERDRVLRLTHML